MDDDRLTDLGPSGGGGYDAALDDWLGRTYPRGRPVTAWFAGASCHGALARLSSRCPLGGSAFTGPTPRCAGRSCGNRGLSCPTRISSCASHVDTPYRRRVLEPERVRHRFAGFGSAGQAGAVQLPGPAGPADPHGGLRDQCAGNGRSFFAAQQGQPVPGTPWRLGAIGVAAWRGVPLSVVLERAGITREAVDVMPSGLDPDLVMAAVSYGRVRRPIPVAKALDDVILAYEMNGEPLPPDHGYPVRVIVPHWAGIASIKWVGQIEVSATPRSPTGTPGLPAVRAGLPAWRNVHHHPAGQERVRTRLERAAAREPGVLAYRAVLVGQRAHHPHRDQHRRRAALAPGHPARPRRPGCLATMGVPMAHSQPGALHAAGQGHRPNRRHPVRDRPRQHLRIPLRRHSRASRQHGLTAGSAPKRQATMWVLSGPVQSLHPGDDEDAKPA